jgi:hypothetical protein
MKTHIKSNRSECNSNRWWEFYFVRYLVGTIIGAILLYNLNIQNNSVLYQKIFPGLLTISEIKNELLIILGVLGFAFCYVASAPILVLHATRGVFYKKENKSKLYVEFVILLILTMIVTFSINHFLEKNIPVLNMLTIAISAFIIFIQFFLIWRSIQKTDKNIVGIASDYYSDLTEARSTHSEKNKQYVESYKHLREHGNAFLIILFEFFLAWLLYSASSFFYSGLLLFMWILPAALIWVAGTALEFSYTRNQK